MNKIYLDHAAATPMHPEVIDHMAEVMRNEWGNPSSIHFHGRSARHLVDEARDKIAAAIGSHPNELVFTSGGTESDNLAIFGAVKAKSGQGNHVITTAIEHHAVLHSFQELEKQGYEVTYLEPDSHGVVSPEAVARALREDTIFVSVMMGNNEVGTLQPIPEIGDILRGHQAIFHSDAVQAFGIMDVNVNDLKVDLMSASAHKINGPRGIGLLYVRDGILLSQQVFGGEQERKRRAGTENVAAIAGYSMALSISREMAAERSEKYRAYKQLFMATLDKEGILYHLNGLLDKSLPHVLNLSFPGTNVESMLVNLDLAGIAASSGSACTAGSINPSHVLVSMFGEESERLKNSIRFSFGLGTSEEDVVRAAGEAATIVRRLASR